MKTAHWDEILELDVGERIELAGDIWDSVVAVPERVHLADWQRDELRRRLERYRVDPSAGSPWDVVKQRVRSSR